MAIVYEGKLLIDLKGQDGNAFNMMYIAEELGKAKGYKKIERKKIIEAMMSDDYDHLLAVFERYFGDVTKYV
jgi:hypothetical protein